MKLKFRGVLPAVLTPFGRDGSVDQKALAENIRWLVDNGVHGIVGLGTLGEAGSLSFAERQSVTRAIIEATDKRVPVTIGVSAATPEDAKKYAQDAESAGAHGLMSLPPTTYQADSNELHDYFSKLAGATSLPIMLYNNPSACKNDLDPATVAALFKIDQVVAVKECSLDVRRMAAILEATAGAMEVLVGSDDCAMEGFCVGATGWVSGCANAAPKESVELLRLCERGDLGPARDLYERMLPLARLDIEPKLVQFFKASLDAVGKYGGPCRAPRGPLSDMERKRVAEAMTILSRPPAAVR